MPRAPCSDAYSRPGKHPYYFTVEQYSMRHASVSVKSHIDISRPFLTPWVGRGGPRIGEAGPAGVAISDRSGDPGGAGPSASRSPTERKAVCGNVCSALQAGRLSGFGHGSPRYVSRHIIVSERQPAAFRSPYGLRPIRFEAIARGLPAVMRAGIKSRSGFAPAGPITDTSRVPQLAAKPEVNDRHDSDGAIHHLRVRTYAWRNASATDRLGDASQ